MKDTLLHKNIDNSLKQTIEEFENYLGLWYNSPNDLPPEVAAKQECVRITLQNT